MIQNVLGYFLDPQQRTFIPYLVLALVMAYIVYLRSALKKGKGSFRNFGEYFFPSSVYKHPSAHLDILYFFIYRIFLFGFVVYFAVSSVWVSQLIRQELGGMSWMPAWTVPNRYFLDILLTAVLLITVDFSLFFTHYYFHKIPLLWEFHKVHHSAQVLTPMTVYRMHPFEDFLNISIAGLLTGAAEGFLLSCFAERPAVVSVMGVNIFFFLYYLFGYNLRHSHIWLPYGKKMSHFLISPAQHQIHHSRAREHWDKNLGFVFAFWDWLAGTLVVPEKPLDLDFGLANHEDKEYHNIRHLLFLPFKKSRKRILKPHGLPAQI